MKLIRFIFNQFRVWLVLFALAKLYFLLVNAESLKTDIVQFPHMWWSGLWLDFSVIGYVLVIPVLLALLSKLMKRNFVKIGNVYFWVVIVAIIIVLAVDPFFFFYWGQKSNTSFTQFLGKETAGFASIEWSHYLIAFTFIVLAMNRYWMKWKTLLIVPSQLSFTGLLLLAALCSVMIRGSFDKVPINISSAYYSSNNVYNNTAVNAVWSALSNEVEKSKNKSMHFFADEKAEQLYAEMFADSAKNDYQSLVSVNDSTNVLLIVLESFSAKTSAMLYGDKYNATPNLDSWMKQGVCFTNAYASSFRSDKGLLALTYGVPATAHQTLTNYPERLVNKTSTFQMFNASHHTSFYYGGNLEFVNIKVLFKDADLVIGEDDFDSALENAWGTHDEVVFKKFANDFLKIKLPQFKMLFSLSSHEPFDVPNYNKKDNTYLNSISYTDSCLGVLLNTLSKSEKWKNTLVILTADHGTVKPDNAPTFDTTNFRIPMVLIGGAVRKDSIVADIVSQTQIPATFAQLLNRKNPYIQSSILTPTNKAIYSYFDGVVIVTPTCVQRYDFGFKNYVGKPCLPPYERVYYQISNKWFYAN